MDCLLQKLKGLRTSKVESPKYRRQRTTVRDKSSQASTSDTSSYYSASSNFIDKRAEVLMQAAFATVFTLPLPWCRSLQRGVTAQGLSLSLDRGSKWQASRVARDKPWNTLCKKSHGIPSSPRAAAVAKFRLLTGHDCLCAHLFRFNLVTSPICVLCDTGQDMTAAHLDECSALNDLNCIVKRSVGSGREKKKREIGMARKRAENIEGSLGFPGFVKPVFTKDSKPLGRRKRSLGYLGSVKPALT
ncbi:uncharacterized protein TNCV_1962231 [Trichonephila clavipes]|nr:uncharacterized protein TNCV_1962231 [Trichonephila clavipes]